MQTVMLVIAGVMVLGVPVIARSPRVVRVVATWLARLLAALSIGHAIAGCGGSAPTPLSICEVAEKAIATGCDVLEQWADARAAGGDGVMVGGVGCGAPEPATSGGEASPAATE